MNDVLNLFVTATVLLFVTMAAIGCGKSDEFYTAPSAIPGPVGPTGPAGSQGDPGVSGITIVQLCGSCVATYPSVFPEVGECINGVLYGVYSANDGFLSEITPGTYSSAGIDCSCTFTVSANCEVTGV